MCSVHVTEYDKSLIFQLLPDEFDWYYGVIIIVLFTKTYNNIDNAY